MACPRCHAEISLGMRFCGHCGAPLPLPCPRCGASNPPEHRFCSHCAAPLDEPEAVASAVPPVLGPEIDAAAELKRVSLLFCDIVGSTGLAERLGPEAMHELIRWFLDTALAEVHRYEGTAPQFTGDGFLALFGAPVAREDHVQLALLAALAIQRAVAGQERTPGNRRWPDLQVRIGIHSGLVVFGSVGGNMRMDPTVIGDAANVAARLQGAADPGTILVSDEVRRLAEGYARVEPVGPLQLKGKDEPIAAYRLLGVSHGRAAERSGAAARSRRFVDRDGELTGLNDFLRAVERGSGRLVGVVGDPGIGKSRLVAEFRRRVASPVTWIEGRCLSYGTAIPYLLVLDLLRSICGIVESDTPEAIAEKLREALRQSGMDPERDASLLLHLLGIEEIGGTAALASPEVVKAKAFDTLRRLAVGGGRRHPLVMLLDDLHWVDRVSEEFLGGFAEAMAGSSILLLATYRPGYRPSWMDRSYAAQLPLQPLSPADSREVVRSVPARLDERVTEAIVAKADGNPLFLEQLALDAAETHGAQAAGRVPNTIHDVVMARIDRLPDQTRRLLQTAAVIGREFSLPLLRAVWRGSDPEPHLHELIRLEFLYEREASGDATYVFRHPLTQEAAYQSLLERTRKNRHAAIGVALEQLYRGRIDEVAEMLAFHFGRSEAAEKAVDYAILAGEKAQRRWANADSLAYFDAALARLDTMPDSEQNRLRRIDAVLKQGDVKFALGRHAEHIRALEDIRDIVQDADDPHRRATLYYWSGYLRSLTGRRLALAIEDCQKAAAIASAAGLDEIVGFADSSLAMAYVFAGRLRDAIAAGERALATFEARGNRWWASRTLWHLSIAANALGEWEASIAYCGRALDHAAALDDSRARAIGLWRMGSVHVQRGDVQRGIECCDEALALAPPPYDMAHAKAVRGYGQIKAGRLEAGIAELTEALAWFEKFQLRQPSLRWALWLAEGHLLRGDAASAQSLAEDILEASREAGYCYIEGLACYLMSDCLGHDAATAEQYIENAIRIFEATGSRNDLAKALATRAALRRRTGDCAGARQLFGRAYDIVAALGTRDEMARIAAALVELDRGASPACKNPAGSVRPPAGGGEAIGTAATQSTKPAEETSKCPR
jgi:class 3 adenylate cyclase/tetratricopeptide (TPR) repeat protein